MWNVYISPVAWVLLFTPMTLAAEVEYVTDIAEYSLLPPCVANALSYAIAGQTMFGDCADSEDQVALQECICSESTVHEIVSSSMASDVTSDCGRSATQDQQSASKFFEKYCDPDFDLDFSTPTTNIVNAYITDLEEMGRLAPCASDALSGAVMAESQSRCPTDASLLAPCVCSKRNVAEDVRTTISRSVRYSCGNTEDVTMAFNFFDEYCAMNEGTTTFAKPESPPGDMSYYITALPQYSSLNECAQSALSSIVMSQSHWKCADGPQALASCVCLKSGMSVSVKRDLTSEVKNLCGNTKTDEVSSADEVYDFYCSAVEDLVVAQVTESIPQTEEMKTAASRTGSGESSPSETGSGGGDGNSDSQNGDNNNSGGGGSVNKTAVIVGSVLGGVIGIALILGIAWFIRRKNKKAKMGQSGPSSPSEYRGISELHSSHSGAHPNKDITGGEALELSSEERRQELQAHSHADRLVPFHKPHEMDGSTVEHSTGSLQSPPRSHDGVSPLSPEQRERREMGWQSGPTETYEMDSESARRP